MEDGSKNINWSSLPQDIIYEILTWVSLETLHACRRVCKEWRRTTYEPNFISLHCHRTRTITGYFIQSMKRNIYSSTFIPFKTSRSSILHPSLGFLPEGIQILSSTHRGILCCESPFFYRIPRYYICKSATKQWRMIPNPRTKFFTKKVAIVASPTGRLDFRIVRLSNPRNNVNYMICEIFDSQTWRWRRFKDLPPLIFHPYPGVELDGVVHWLVGDDSTIFAFDIIREDWKLIPLPQWPQGEKLWRDNKLVVECEGQLCLLRATNKDGMGGNDLEIWAMVDRYENMWEKIFKDGPANRHIVKDLYIQQVAFFTTIGEVMWYDFKSKETTNVKVNHESSTVVFRYESDFNSCSLDSRMD